jgi:hypothetical protein
MCPDGTCCPRPNDRLDLLAHRRQANPQRLQRLGSNALALVDQAK